jgi:hypothetical protein
MDFPLTLLLIAWKQRISVGIMPNINESRNSLLGDSPRNATFSAGGGLRVSTIQESHLRLTYIQT